MILSIVILSRLGSRVRGYNTNIEIQYKFTPVEVRHTDIFRTCYEAL